MKRDVKTLLTLASGVTIPLSEIEVKAIQSQGPGGQNVNKVAAAIQLNFDIAGSSLPERAKRQLLKGADHRINKEGILMIKSQEYRSQEANRQAALRRLSEIIGKSLVVPKRRRSTRPTKASKEKRLRSKTIRARAKSLRGRVRDE